MIFFFSKKGMILYSWLPIQTYPKKMVSLKKKILKIWRILGHFFPPKNPFHTLKLYMSGQNLMKTRQQKLINYQITNCHSCKPLKYVVYAM
jgi:hypothetical protein